MDKGSTGKNVAGLDSSFASTIKQLTCNAILNNSTSMSSITTTNFNAGGKLTLAANTAGYTILGSNAVDGASNTRLVVSGINRSGTNAGGWIEYIATSNGDHRFYSNTTQSALISKSGVLTASACETGVQTKQFYMSGNLPATTAAVFVDLPAGCLSANVVQISAIIQPIFQIWVPASTSSTNSTEVQFTATVDNKIAIKLPNTTVASKPYRVLITTL